MPKKFGILSIDAEGSGSKVTMIKIFGLVWFGLDIALRPSQQFLAHLSRRLTR